MCVSIRLLHLKKNTIKATDNLYANAPELIKLLFDQRIRHTIINNYKKNNVV